MKNQNSKSNFKKWMIGLGMVLVLTLIILVVIKNKPDFFSAKLVQVGEEALIEAIDDELSQISEEGGGLPEPIGEETAEISFTMNIYDYEEEPVITTNQELRYQTTISSTNPDSLGGLNLVWRPEDLEATEDFADLGLETCQNLDGLWKIAAEGCYMGWPNTPPGQFRQARAAFLTEGTYYFTAYFRENSDGISNSNPWQHDDWKLAGYPDPTPITVSSYDEDVGYYDRPVTIYTSQWQPDFIIPDDDFMPDGSRPSKTPIIQKDTGLQFRTRLVDTDTGTNPADPVSRVAYLISEANEFPELPDDPPPYLLDVPECSVTDGMIVADGDCHFFAAENPDTTTPTPVSYIDTLLFPKVGTYYFTVFAKEHVTLPNGNEYEVRPINNHNPLDAIRITVQDTTPNSQVTITPSVIGLSSNDLTYPINITLTLKAIMTDLENDPVSFTQFLLTDRWIEDPNNEDEIPLDAICEQDAQGNFLVDGTCYFFLTEGEDFDNPIPVNTPHTFSQSVKFTGAGNYYFTVFTRETIGDDEYRWAHTHTLEDAISINIRESENQAPEIISHDIDVSVLGQGSNELINLSVEMHAYDENANLQDAAILYVFDEVIDTSLPRFRSTSELAEYLESKGIPINPPTCSNTPDTLPCRTIIPKISGQIWDEPGHKEYAALIPLYPFYNNNSERERSYLIVTVDSENLSDSRSGKFAVPVGPVEPAFGDVTLELQVPLQDRDNNPATDRGTHASKVWVQVQNPAVNTPAVIKSFETDAEGRASVEFNNIPLGENIISVKTDQHLSKSITTNLVAGKNTVNFSYLLGGDIAGSRHPVATETFDDVINATDIGDLYLYWGTKLGDADYSRIADLDANTEVGAEDFSTLISNAGKNGTW